MAVIGHSPDELFEKLYRHENFRGYPFRAREADFGAQQPLTIPRPFNKCLAEVSFNAATSTSNAAGARKLQKRLAKIFREERTLEEEQGLSTLYLALGFLRWFDSDQAEDLVDPCFSFP